MEDKLNLTINRARSFLLKKDIRLAVAIAAAFIVMGAFIGFYNNKVVLKNPDAQAHYTQEPSNGLSFMSNWDGPDYIKIAGHGYGYSGNANFFPLYPLLIYVVHLAVGSMLDSALIISWFALVGAIYFYLKTLKHIFKLEGKYAIEAPRALLFFLLFPTGIFLLATYTESLFAFFALASIYYALNKKYLFSSIFLALTTATHITGVFIIFLVGMILLEEKANIKKIALTLIGGSLGLIAYAYYLWIKFKAPLAFISSQKHHGWLNSSYGSLLANMDFFNAVFIILLILSIIYWWRRRLSFSFYSLLFLFIPIIGRQFGGFNRYVLMAFPVQFMLYGFLRNRRTLFTVGLILSTVGWTYFMLQYAGGYVGG